LNSDSIVSHESREAQRLNWFVRVFASTVHPLLVAAAVIANGLSILQAQPIPRDPPCQQLLFKKQASEEGPDSCPEGIPYRSGARTKRVVATCCEDAVVLLLDYFDANLLVVAVYDFDFIVVRRITLRVVNSMRCYHITGIPGRRGPLEV